MPALERANEALLGRLFDVAPTEPYAATILRARQARGVATDPRPLLAQWDAAHPGSAVGALRYRWVVNHQHVDIPRWAESPARWAPWRPAELAVMGDSFEFESRLSIPAIVTDCGELLAELQDAVAPHVPAVPIGGGAPALPAVPPVPPVSAPPTAAPPPVPAAPVAPVAPLCTPAQLGANTTTNTNANAIAVDRPQCLRMSRRLRARRDHSVGIARRRSLGNP